MRRSHLSIAWGVLVACFALDRGTDRLDPRFRITFLFAFVIPACVTAGLFVLWRRGDREVGSSSHYRPSTLHSRRRTR